MALSKMITPRTSAGCSTSTSRGHRSRGSSSLAKSRTAGKAIVRCASAASPSRRQTRCGGCTGGSTYVLAYYNLLDWLGFAFRYGYFDDMDGGRTGVTQVLQSWTFVPILHLSRLIPDLAPTGAAFARSRTPIDWVNVKLEYRLNHSNKPVFSDTK